MARLAFFGTPELAAVQLRALLAASERHEVVIVVAQPDRPRGRGQKLEPPPTKALALEKNIEVAQPETLKKDTPSGEEFYARFASMKIELAVVAAYGRILPRRLLGVCEFVNVHASLLPRWRGAAPIQRSIEAGDEKTGVCLMQMVPELDAGDVYCQGELAIANDDDGDTLTHKVAALGARLLSDNLDALVDKKLARVPQPAEGVTYASQLTKDDGRIDWTKTARALHCHARAMQPWPGAFTTLDGEVLKLFRPAEAHATRERAEPGEVLGTADGLAVACAEGAIAFLEAQLPNKKRMPVADLVRGRPIPAGTKLGGPGARADAGDKGPPP